MPRLCFKTRLDGTTVQLVRHIYCPKLKRSRTVTLGSVPLDADPDDFRHALRLAPDSVLDEEEIAVVADWLRLHGDVDAAQRRREAVERVRQTLLAEQVSAAGDDFEQAVKALDAVADALPVLAQVHGEGARAKLRPRYLNITAASERLLRVAQACGVAKTMKRGRRAPSPAPAAPAS